MQKGRVNIYRFQPETDSAPRLVAYDFPFAAGMTVLDVVMYIYQEVDGTLGFSYCCRNSHCGLCGVKINGRPGLMCRESAVADMTLAPLDHLPVVRDLMVDLNAYEDQMAGLRLFLERVRPPHNLPEKIDREDHDLFKVVSRCVKCYNCVSACSALRRKPHAFLGPAAVVQLARHAFDPRDELNREVMLHAAGIDQCVLCDQCTKVCPHGISPRKSIEILRQRIERLKAPGV